MLIALPKGRLLPEIKKLFLKIGIEFDSDSRKLIIDTSVKDFKVAILRTWDIPKFVNYGAADIGIVGKDILYETNLDNNYYAKQYKINFLLIIIICIRRTHVHHCYKSQSKILG